MRLAVVQSYRGANTKTFYLWDFVIFFFFFFPLTFFTLGGGSKEGCLDAVCLHDNVALCCERKVTRQKHPIRITNGIVPQHVF